MACIKERLLIKSAYDGAYGMHIHMIKIKLKTYILQVHKRIVTAETIRGITLRSSAGSQNDDSIRAMVLSIELVKALLFSNDQKHIRGAQKMNLFTILVEL